MCSDERDVVVGFVADGSGRGAESLGSCSVMVDEGAGTLVSRSGSASASGPGTVALSGVLDRCSSGVSVLSSLSASAAVLRWQSMSAASGTDLTVMVSSKASGRSSRLVL